MIDYGLVEKGVKWGHRMAISQFSGGRSHTVGMKDKKKFNFKEIREVNAQSYFLGAMEVIQMLMALANEVELKESDETKYDLLLGDMDILYQESIKGVQKYFPKMVVPSIEEIMTNKKKFTVSIMDINENTETQDQETSTATIH